MKNIKLIYMVQNQVLDAQHTLLVESTVELCLWAHLS